MKPTPTIDDQLLKRMVEALWSTQWTTKWAAENIVCAYDCWKVAHKDQKAHYLGCPFVKLWNDAKYVREYLGVTADFK